MSLAIVHRRGMPATLWVRSLWPVGAAVAVWLAYASIAGTLDFAEARHAEDWLHHPVYGDPSFDSFRHWTGNPIHRGAAPYEWPVNGFYFADPRSRDWYIYVGEYGKGYLSPPSRCLLYRSKDRGRSWSNLGVVLQGDPHMFDRGGHTPDVSVVYADGRYHMVYDWGEPDFNAEGGLAYAWAERPEGPWHRAAQPITRNSTLAKLEGRYQRTYAATLLRRAHDWLILGMMDHAPHSWALFAMTAPEPQGPYSERRLVRQVEGDYFHPPLLEFFPAFIHAGLVFAPATSVALNRDFNVLFCAPLEQADDPAAWRQFQADSVWHSEDRPEEDFGIWGQTFSGFVDGKGQLEVMFPSRDAEGRGTINLAARSWSQPYRRRGFVLSAHQGPSLTLLRRAYDDFVLAASFRLQGTMRWLLDYAAPLGPNTASSDASLHPLMNTRHLALEIAPSQWTMLKNNASGESQVLASGQLVPRSRRALQVEQRRGRLVVELDGKGLWSSQTPIDRELANAGVLGLRLEPHSHVLVERFRLQGLPRPAEWFFLCTEALLGAGESPADWDELRDSHFRFEFGVISKRATARAKWNVLGSALTLWSPRGPGFGKVDVLLDGRWAASLDLYNERATSSGPVWRFTGVNGFHAVVLVPRTGPMPVDCLQVGGAR